MSLLGYSWGTLFRSVQLKYDLIVINQLFNCTHYSSTDFEAYKLTIFFTTNISDVLVYCTLECETSDEMT
jgi:hypothetical protein